MNGLDSVVDCYGVQVFEGTKSWRTRSVSKTLRRALDIRRQIGITRIADLTELDYLGIPVASAVRPRVDSVQVTASHGKGFSVAQALVSALMEAAERWAASQSLKTEISSLSSLGRQHRRYAKPETLGGTLEPDELAEWISAVSLSDNSDVLVPASDVLFPYFPPEGCVRPSRPCTSGLASGNTLREAILYGLCETIERATVSTAWRDGKVRAIDIESLPDSEGEWLRKLEERGVKTIVCHLDNPLIPVITVVTFDDHWLGPHVAIGGHGAHLCGRVALRRAITEAAQSRIAALQGSREDLHRHASKWADQGESGRALFDHLKNSLATVKWSPQIIDSPISIVRALEVVSARLRNVGYEEIYYVNLSADLPEIYIVRVIVPGLVDSFVKGW